MTLFTWFWANFWPKVHALAKSFCFWSHLATWPNLLLAFRSYLKFCWNLAFSMEFRYFHEINAHENLARTWPRVNLHTWHGFAHQVKQLSDQRKHLRDRFSPWPRPYFYCVPFLRFLAKSSFFTLISNLKSTSFWPNVGQFKFSWPNMAKNEKECVFLANKHIFEFKDEILANIWIVQSVSCEIHGNGWKVGILSCS